MRWLRIFIYKWTSVSLVMEGKRWYVKILYWFWSKFYELGMLMEPEYRKNAEKMVHAVVRKGDRVLDVGTGTGLLATFGAPLASEYVGIDYSGSMLSKAIRKAARQRFANVILRWGDAMALPFEDQSFDCVVTSFMFAHLAKKERAKALSEMNRVLKPGGRIGMFQLCGERFPLFSTRKEMDGYMETAGFILVRYEESDEIFRIVTANK